MKKEAILGVLVGAVIIGYILFYIGSRRYLLEYFQQTEAGPKAMKDVTAGGTVQVNSGDTKQVDLTPVEVPYTKTPINAVDDYEYNMVYENESDKALTKELRDKLMSQYPMDWSGYPPSSSQFQAGLRESFENAKPSVPDDAKPYQNISGNLMQPPDKSEVEKQERKILQTYKPKFPPTPTSYDVRDADALIKQVYDGRGLIPEVKHRDGTNVYEIVGVRRKDEKIVYEDEEATVSPAANPMAMESNIQAPLAAKDMNSPEKDSFFDAGSPGKTRANKWDYTSWTPGLERMFAPTAPQQQWY
jgi:hypothetical protein